MININLLKTNDLNTFFEYLTNHLLENGRLGNPLFQPLTKGQSKLCFEWKEKFESNLNKSSDNVAERKRWIASNQENQIAGHIDIRSHNELNTEHRVLLGIRIDRNFRILKI